MQLEILKFYPKEKNEKGFISGEIKIRLPVLAINILGIYVARRENSKWLILLPCKIGVGLEGKKVQYPIVSFDEADHKALMAELYAQLPSFIEKRIADASNPIIWPPAKQPTASASHQKEPLGERASLGNGKPAPATPKANSALSAKSATKVFRDLPPRPPTTKSKGRYIVKSI